MLGGIIFDALANSNESHADGEFNMSLAFEMKEGGCFEKLCQNVNFRNGCSAIQVGMCTCTWFENLKTGFLATGPMLLSTKHMRHFIWVFTVCKGTH